MRKLTCLFWILLALLVYKFSFIEKNQPQTQRKFSIARDEHGIPHIYGKQYEDILFGLGYAEAQDRLWTLFFKKMMLQGRTAEIFGPDMVQTDIEMRNIGYQEIGKMNRNHTDPETMKLLQAYADGINAYARSVKMLPFEFYLLWVNWEEWQVEDSISSIYFMSFSLEFDWLYEIARQRLLETVGFDLATKLIHYGNNLFREVVIVNDEQLKKKGLFVEYSMKKQKEILTEHWINKNMTLGSLQLPHVPGGVEGTGSNGWVVGGQHTVDGRPILANDPHVPSLIPNLFYTFEVVRLSEDNQVLSRKFGVMADGIPSVSIGISDLMSWGSTSAYIDNKDVYYETVRNQTGDFQYKFKDEWHNFKGRKEVIKVRGGEDLEETFYHTHRGVVIETVFMDLHWKYGYPLPQQYKDNHTLTLVASHYLPDNTTAKGLLRLLTLEKTEDFWKINTEMLHPTIDSVFMFPNGTYGYAPTGAIPQRNIPEMGSFIKDGNSDQYDFLPQLPIKEKLIIINPEKGYFSMCNNKVASNNYKHGSSLHQLSTGRSAILDKLITDQIKSKEKFNFQTMMKMQLNTRDEFVCQVLPGFLGKMTNLRQIWSNPQTEALFNKLIDWDCDAHRNSIQAGIYYVFEQMVHESLLKMTALSEHERLAITSHAFFENYYFRLLEQFYLGKLEEGDKLVCQSSETAQYSSVHPCQAMLALAFKKLPSQLKQEFGSSDIEEYQWGKIHRQYFTMIPFSEVPLLNKIWNRGYPAGGNSRTLNVAIYVHAAKKYNAFASPAFRFITDMNKTYYSLETGQSDRIFTSAFFDNFLDKNMYLEYVPINPYKEGLPATWHFSIEKLA